MFFKHFVEVVAGCQFVVTDVEFGGEEIFHCFAKDFLIMSLITENVSIHFSRIKKGTAVLKGLFCKLKSAAGFPAGFSVRDYFDYVLGLAAQDNLDRNVLLVVKKNKSRFPVQTEGLALWTPMTPLKRCQSQTF